VKSSIRYLPIGRSFQPISALHLPAWNPRTVTSSDFKALVASIKARPGFLVRRPVLVADGPVYRAGGIVHGGNQRTRAVEELFGQSWVPPAELAWPQGTVPVDVDDIPEKEAWSLALIDNNSAGGYDDEALAELTYMLKQADADLSVLGFTTKEVENLLNHSGALGDADGVSRSRETPATGGVESSASDAYESQSVRQLVLYYPKSEFPATLEMLDWLREHFKADTNTQAVTAALAAFRQMVDS
jgi:hypothetical protein